MKEQKQTQSCARTYILAGNYKMLDALYAERDQLRRDHDQLLSSEAEMSMRCDQLRAENTELKRANSETWAGSPKVKAELDQLRLENARFKGAFREIMAYTDPCEDRAYVIAEGALEDAARSKENKP